MVLLLCRHHFLFPLSASQKAVHFYNKSVIPIYLFFLCGSTALGLVCQQDFWDTYVCVCVFVRFLFVCLYLCERERE